MNYLNWLNNNPGLGIIIAIAALIAPGLIILLIKIVNHLFKGIIENKKFKKDFLEFTKKYSVIWMAEKNIGEKTGTYVVAKQVLSQMFEEASSFITRIKAKATLQDAFGKILMDLKEAENKRIYIDGGLSFKDFWAKGDKIFIDLKQIGDKL